MKALVLVELVDQSACKLSRSVISALAPHVSEIHCLLVGKGALDGASSVSRYEGVSKVWVFDRDEPMWCIAHNVASVLLALSSKYDVFASVSSSYGKDILPRLAALLDVPMASDVINLDAIDQVTRPIYAGNAHETITLHSDKYVMTIRSVAFDPCEDQTQPAEIEVLALEVALDSRVQWVSQNESTHSDVSLTDAPFVVCGGRGLQDAAQFDKLEELAGKTRGAMGATRAVVDAGWVPNDRQVGQTGKIVAPDVYLALGISGAIQHLAGIKDSKMIVAVNNDPEAPIFEFADYGLIADAVAVLERLNNEF